MRRHRCPVFVGRAEEFTRLLAGFDAAVDGRGSFALVRGEPGAGKSRLIDEFTAHVRAAGGRVGVGWCAPYSPCLPAAPLLAGLAELVGSEGADAVDEPSGELAEHALRALAGAAREAPAVLVLEDLHWADPTTTRLVSYLATSVRRTHALLVVSMRSGSGGPPLTAIHAEIARKAEHRLDLGGLDRAGTHDFVAALGVVGLGPDAVDALHRRTGGNPFYLEELLAEGTHNGTLPPTLRDLLLMRLRSVPPGGVAVLEAAALACGPIDGTLLARALGTELLEHVDAAVSDALDSALIVTEPPSGFGFRHDLVREAVAAGVLPDRRATLHRRLAEAYVSASALADDEFATAAAQHWELAGETRHAFELALAALHAAHAHGRPRDEVEHARRALRSWRADSGITRGDLLSSAAIAARHAGLAAESVHWAAQAVAETDRSVDPLTHAQALTRLARATWACGDPHQAMLLSERAVGVVGPLAPSSVQAGVFAAHAQSLLTSGRSGEALAAGRSAIAAARHVRDRVVESHAAITVGAALGELGRPDHAATQLRGAWDLAAELDLSDEQLRAAHNSCGPLLDLGRVDEALDLLRRGIAIAARTGRTSKGRTLRLLLAEVLLRRGRVAEAVSVLADEPDGGGVRSAQHVYVAGCLALARGDLGSAQQLLDSATARRQQASDQDPNLWLIAADLHARLGLIDVARAEIDHARAELADAGIPGPRLEALARAALVEDEAARWEVDDTAEQRCAALSEEAREAIRRLGKPVPAGIEAWHRVVRAVDRSGTNAPGDECVRRWSAAVDAAEAAQFSYLADQARLAQAEALLHLPSGRDAAAGLVAEVAQRARFSGAAAIAADADELATRARLHTTMARQASAPTGIGAAAGLGLTPREAEVLGHLGAGHTNRQIAADLYISEKTASVHVSNVLRKLRVSSRIDAGAMAQRLGNSGPA